MNLSSLAARLGRAQRSRGFMIGATIAVWLLAAALVVTYAATTDTGAGSAGDLLALPEPPEAADVSPEVAAQQRAQYTATRMSVQIINELRTGRQGWAGAAVLAASGAALATGVIWLGVGLTALLVLALLGAVAAPMLLFGSPRVRSVGLFVLGAGVLSLSFSVLMQVLALALGGSGPVLGVARNVVREAIRLKISAVFIVLLILALASLPGLLDPTNPLRYRVQSFLQYGTGGAFWIIAVLVLFLSVGSVTFEQRDKIIWQTMTKPVAAWQYLLGKWIGVSGVAAVLLGVSAAGVFLFTEHLRNQPAVGEVAAGVPEPGRLYSEDRLVLESQVLAAREAIRPVVPPPDPQAIESALRGRIEQAMRNASGFTPTPEIEEEIRAELQEDWLAQFFSIPPRNYREYRFVGLERARSAGRPMTLRYKINAGANDPEARYRLTLTTPGDDAFVTQVPLGQPLSLPLSPGAIAEDGSLTIRIRNGDEYTGLANPETLQFPPGGLEVYSVAGSYYGNFARAAVVLWLKLVFLAAVGVTAGTFLSFPVACLVAFGVFVCAEGSAWLVNSLDYYASVDEEGNLMLHRVLIRGLAVPVAYGLRFYDEVNPTESLVEGRLIPWMTVLRSAALLAGLGGALYLAGTVIFRRRELAMYSGQ